jgi:hypothetical protein
MWGYGLVRAGLGQRQVVGTCECGNEPSGFIEWGKFLTSWKPVSFQRGTLLHGVSKKVYLKAILLVCEQNYPAQFRDKVQAFVNTVMNLLFPQRVANFLSSSGIIGLSVREVGVHETIILKKYKVDLTLSWLSEIKYFLWIIFASSNMTWWSEPVIFHKHFYQKQQSQPALFL